ncbi:MAG: transglycosylase family protein [Patescibacteria group bacterium]|nr:transglycosylase family protein [Patescibacteria group bacterium]
MVKPAHRKRSTTRARRVLGLTILAGAALVTTAASSPSPTTERESAGQPLTVTGPVAPPTTVDKAWLKGLYLLPTTTTTTEAPPPRPPNLPSPEPLTSAAPVVGGGNQAGEAIPATTGSLAADFACIRHFESGDNYADTDNPNYRGAYQFSWSTWEGVGGTGDPAMASPAEQDMRAEMLQARYGWSQWSTAPLCGL